MINLMTWNVKWSSDTSQVITETARLADENGADIVCLQEVCLARLKSGLTHLPSQLSKATSMSALAVPHPVPNGTWWEGLVILSRYEIANPARHLLSVHRSYLFAVILHPQVPWLRVGNVHISAFSKGWREREVRRALCLHEPASALVCGDFNLAPDEPVMREAAGKYQLDESGPTNGRRKIDYVLSGPGLEIVSSRTLSSGLSDHRPLMATISPR